MTSQSAVFNVQEFTDSGDPLVGGRVYTLIQGTTTHKNAYTDAAGLIPHQYTSDLAGGLYIALNARGELSAPLYLAAGSYDITLRRADGSTVWTRRADPCGDAATDADALLRSDLADTASTSKGLGLVGLNPTLAYAANTAGRSLADREWNPRDYPWLAKFDGVTDDTAALLTCLTAIYNAGGGTMVMPRGTAMVSSLVFAWAAAVSVNIRGAGMQATVLKKIAGTATPVLDFSAPSNVLNVYSNFSNFSILGSAKLGNGFHLTNLADIKLDSVYVANCDVAFENLGSLVFSVNRCAFVGNKIGYRCRAANLIHANLVKFTGTRFVANTLFGIDLGQCSGVNIDGCDIESNGTAADLTTGGVRIRSTVDDETGYSTISFTGNTWLEANFGETFYVEPAAGLELSLNDVSLLSSEGGRAANIGAVQNVILQNVLAAGPSDVVTITSAANSTVTGGNIATLTDSSTNRTRINTVSSAGSSGFNAIGATLGAGGLFIDPTAYISGKTSLVEGDKIAGFRNVLGNEHAFFATNSGAGNAAATGLRVGTHSGTGRSINAGGTINAAGADYAEYMVKAPGCGTIAAGAIVGFTAGGLITDKWADAIAYAVKSTDPSIVGGDRWGDGLEGDALEAARQCVDRIAYSGQVPVNVVGAPGAYIVPVQAGAGISGVAVVAPTFDQYRMAVGRVIATEPDGRARIIVKAA